MKKVFGLIIVLTLLINNLVIVKAETIQVPQGTVLSCYTDDDIKRAADEIFVDMNPKEGTTKDIVTLYKGGRYKDALILFRNYMVDRFRAASANRIFLNIGGYSQGYCRDSISVICGDMTLHEYNTKHNRNTVDIAGYLNYIDTQTDSHLNWLPIPEEGYEALPVFGYMGFGGRIAHMYALTGEDKYIKKYFQIMSDYAQNYRDIIEKPMEGMTDEEKIAYAKDVDTRVYVKVNSAGANLNFAQKSFDIIGSLAVMCKALGKTENSVASYTSDDAVYVDKLDESVYDVIDPVRFAHICKHLIYNEMERTSVYLSVEAISNQKIAGLSAYFRYVCIFKDFNSAVANNKQMYQVINDTFLSTVHNDGGLVEKSLNYNANDMDSRRTMYEFAKVMYPDSLKNLLNYSKMIHYWDKLVEGYSSNLGELPSIGNKTVVGTPNIWNYPNLYQSMQEKTSSNRDLAYNSVYYPCSGYVAMRNNWNIDGLYMGTYNNPNTYKGHYSAETNAILNLSAYGRTMLLSGGSPYYGRSYVPSTYTEFLENKYDELNGYFSENSGRKVSTVMVNGKSQAHENYIKTTTEDSILNNRWFSNNVFDFSEGVWKGRYTPFDTEEALTTTYTEDDIESSAEHTRQIIFVKEAGVWLVTDKLNNVWDKENEYTQVWNFSQYQELSKKNNEGKGGYKNEQVILSDNMIYTADENGPNLFIESFSNESLEYEKKYGEFIKGQTGWGWSKGGGAEYAETGGFVPSVDVLVKWRGVANGATSVVSVLTPSRDKNNPILEKQDLSDENKTGCRIVTKDKIIIYITSDQTQSYTYKQKNIVAKTILIVDDGKTIKGITLGTFSIDGNNDVATDTEFEISSSETVYSNVEVPERFNWLEFSDGQEIPIYSDDSYYTMLKRNIDENKVKLDYDSLNENNFDEFVDKYWPYLEINYDEYLEIKYPKYLYRSMPKGINLTKFIEILPQKMKEFKIQTKYLLDYGIYFNASKKWIEWKESSSIYSNPLYLGFDIPLGEAVLDAKLTLTKNGSNTNTRKAHMTAYISGEHPNTIEYLKNDAGELYEQWAAMSERECEMPGTYTFSFEANVEFPKKTLSLSQSIINEINQHSNIIFKMYTGSNTAIIYAPETENTPYLTLMYDKSTILNAIDTYKDDEKAKEAYNLIANESEIITGDYEFDAVNNVVKINSVKYFLDGKTSISDVDAYISIKNNGRLLSGSIIHLSNLQSGKGIYEIPINCNIYLQKSYDIFEINVYFWEKDFMKPITRKCFLEVINN